MTLVESLAVALTPDFAPVPRRAASDMVLNRHGLTPRGYVALHTGARHAINCWPHDHFYALAERLLAETSYDIVLFAGADARPGSARCDNHRVKIFDYLVIVESDQVHFITIIMVGNYLRT